MFAVSVNSGNSMIAGYIKTETVEDFTPSQVEYNLIGKITKDTGLTRKTIIDILSKIRISVS